MWIYRDVPVIRHTAVLSHEDHSNLITGGRIVASLVAYTFSAYAHDHLACWSLLNLGASFLVLFNAHHDLIEFQLPDPGDGSTWLGEVDTSTETGEVPAERARPHTLYPLQGRSLVVLRQVPPDS